MPRALQTLDVGSNLAKNRRYDQILLYPRHSKCFTNHGGVLDFYTGGIKKLYRDVELDKLAFTYQLSDHLPLWVELDTDIDDEELDQIIKPRRARKRRKN